MAGGLLMLHTNVPVTLSLVLVVHLGVIVLAARAARHPAAWADSGRARSGGQDISDGEPHDRLT